MESHDFEIYHHTIDHSIVVCDDKKKMDIPFTQTDGVFYFSIHIAKGWMG